MRVNLLVWTACFAAPSISTAIQPQQEHSKENDLRHANHIFNTIHSSMRQWGSSLNHNGMSFFLAAVPKGTQFYHGTTQSEPVKGMQWLAFEPEHALVFAHPRRPPRRNPPPFSSNEGRPGANIPEGSNGPPPHPEGRHPDSRREKSHDQLRGDRPRKPTNGMKSPQQPFPPPGGGAYGEAEQSRAGYLHTYRTNKPLRLLYVDGMSAGKTANGTLDTQDLVLLNHTDSAPHGGMWEMERARGLCNLSATEWDNRIDGILRMEMGFEIILCSFEKDLDVVRITATRSEGREGGPGGIENWQYLRAVTSRYWGIGGERVAVDYAHFVTAFTHPIDLFTNDVNSDTPMPRLQKASPSDLHSLKKEVTAMILTHDATAAKQSHNWQATADMVLSRYSDPLNQLHTSSVLRSSPTLLEQILADLVEPFIDYADRNVSLETRRCAVQFIPDLDNGADLAAHVIHSVTSRICESLLTALNVTMSSLIPSPSATFVSSTPPKEALEVIDELVQYLQWTTWKYCGTCQDGTLCLIPIWPMGSFEEHKEPKCINEEESKGQRGYWGDRRHGPPPPGEGEGMDGPPPMGYEDMGGR